MHRECFYSKNSELFFIPQFNGNISVTDVLVPEHQFLKKYNFALKSLMNNDSFSSLLSKIYKIILRPNSRMAMEIELERRKLLRRRFTIALQIRMGGKYADLKESFTFLNLENLTKVVETVKKEMRINKFPINETTIFISSDSSIAIQFVKKQLGAEYYVTYSLRYSRGHTTASCVSENSLKSSIIDMYLLYHSDVLIITSKSTFAKACVHICDKSKIVYTSYH
jgi:hypothetical protein